MSEQEFRPMTREQVDRLSPWEHQMGTAIGSTYARAMSREAKAVMIDVYREYSGNPHYTKASNCSGCTLELLLDVGRPYFASKKYYEDLDEAMVLAELDEMAAGEAVEARVRRMKGKKVKTQL